MSTTAGALTSALRTERRNGNLSGETEAHLRHELRRRGWQSDDVRLVEPISQEIERLEREAATLRKLTKETVKQVPHLHRVAQNQP